MDKRKTLITSCSSACTGDSTQTCGGNNLQQVYYTVNTKGKMVMFERNFDCKTSHILSFFNETLHTVVPYWKIPQEDREQWQLSGTPPLDSSNYPFEQIHDGVYGLTKAYMSGYLMFSYLQIDLGSSQLVKGVQMWGKFVEFNHYYCPR